MMKTFLTRSLLGIIFGGFLGVLMTYLAIFFGDLNVLDSGLFVKNSLGAIFCGWLFTVTPLFFEIKSWNLPQQTALHFTTVMVVYGVLAYGIGWVPQGVTNALLFIAIALVIYIGIWIGFYLYFRHESKKMNDDLQHIH